MKGGVSIKLAFSLLFALCFFATGMNGQIVRYFECADSDKLAYKIKNVEAHYDGSIRVVVTFSIPVGGFRCDDKGVIVMADDDMKTFYLCDKIVRYDDTTLIIHHTFPPNPFPKYAGIFIKNSDFSTAGCITLQFNPAIIGSAYEAGRGLPATGHSQV